MPTMNHPLTLFNLMGASDEAKNQAIEDAIADGWTLADAAGAVVVSEFYTKPSAAGNQNFTIAPSVIDSDPCPSLVVEFAMPAGGVTVTATGFVFSGLGGAGAGYALAYSLDDGATWSNGGGVVNEASYHPFAGSTAPNLVTRLPHPSTPGIYLPAPVVEPGDSVLVGVRVQHPTATNPFLLTNPAAGLVPNITVSRS